MLSSQTLTNVCTCIYHQNTILTLDALHTYMPNIPIYNKDFLSSCLESPDSENCWYNKCKHTNCGSEYFYPFPNDDSNNSSIYLQSGSNGRILMVTLLKTKNLVQFLNFTLIQKLL